MNDNDHNQTALQFIDAAFGIGKSIEGSGRDEMMMACADKYAALCLLDDAMRTTEEVSDSYSRDTAISQVAVNTIACDPETDVLSLLEAIEDPGVYNVALEQLTVEYAES